MMDESNRQDLIKELETDLLRLYGTPVLTGEVLSKSLGFKTIHAMRKLLNTKEFPIQAFEIEKRRGKFALIKDIATWLVEQRYPVEDNK